MHVLHPEHPDDRPCGHASWSGAAKRALRRLGTLVLLMGAAGCGTIGAPGGTSSASAPADADPWERWNRKVHAFNDVIDTELLRPVATVYAEVVPQPVRTGVTNFYGNFADAWSAVNNLLQGKLAGSARDVLRVGTNTVLGVAGLFDVATEFGIDSQREDFGQTLGRWGVRDGPYVVWPLLGPSTLRDSAALPLDLYVGPGLAFGDVQTQGGLLILGLVNARANLLPASRMLDDMALDKYVFVRDAYLQRRRILVHDGDVPPDGEALFEADPALPSGPDPVAPVGGVADPASAGGPASARG